MDDLLTTVTHRAMATQFAVMLPRTESRATEVVLESLEMLDGIEAALTIYQDESEISRVNRDAENEPVELSKETFSLLQQAITWSERTNGAFDITAGPLVETWGSRHAVDENPPMQKSLPQNPKSATRISFWIPSDVACNLPNPACPSTWERLAKATRWTDWRQS